ncbi:protein arginine N-methyltransferase 6 [Copidosoma floridanum]|uniref:protein arginine N-methyltransferase 6 n=1 Tax=Copidosoma floridanum TaxID=29053 RepID=UPI0006C97AD5|nr:protein arginine N-methyltransferase 6 [Copidosoma floridanum]
MNDESEKSEYFENYQDIDVHHLMLSDEPRTLAYKNAIFNMKDRFADKIVMDVGAGTGILSIFCAQAGAKKVYAVEASNVSKLISQVAEENNVEKKIQVISRKVEDINPNDIEKVDILVSEWMGFYLLHEGMLDSVLYARDNFLKPDGLLFPSIAKVYTAPCELSKFNSFWDNIHGVSLKCIADFYKKSLSKPQVLTVPKDDTLAEDKLLIWLDLNSVTTEELDALGGEETVIVCNKDGKYQGLAIWFEVEFPNGTCLNTSPAADPTHWKQTVLVLPKSIDVSEKEPIAFKLQLNRDVSNRRWYKVQYEMLDAFETEHDIPCDCYMTKCIVSKAYIETLSEEVIEK